MTIGAERIATAVPWAVAGLVMAQDFPPRQKSASFNVDQVLQRLQEGAGAGK